MYVKMKSDELYSVKKYIVYYIIVIILTVGVSFVINECYKINAGYVTMWSAEDVLSYYGAVLGGGITIITLIGTIYFTRKQIQIDRFLEQKLRSIYEKRYGSCSAYSPKN